MNMMWAAKQGLNDIVNTECFCSWLSNIVNDSGQSSEYGQRTIFIQAKEQSWKMNNEYIDILSGEFAIQLRVDAVV